VQDRDPLLQFWRSRWSCREPCRGIGRGRGGLAGRALDIAGWRGRVAGWDGGWLGGWLDVEVGDAATVEVGGLADARGGGYAGSTTGTRRGVETPVAGSSRVSAPAPFSASGRKSSAPATTAWYRSQVCSGTRYDCPLGPIRPQAK
jgi:hypothetical protein